MRSPLIGFMSRKGLRAMALAGALLSPWTGCSGDDPYGTGDPLKLEIVEAAYEPGRLFVFEP